MVPLQLPGSRRRSEQYRWRERSSSPTWSNTNIWRNSSKKRGERYNQWCTLSFPCLVSLQFQERRRQGAN